LQFHWERIVGKKPVKLMSEDKIVSLGSEGLVYVREHLAGVNILCAALLQAVDNQNGEVFTVAPRDTTKEKLLAFDQGGLLAEDLSRAVRLPDGSTLVPVKSMIAQQISLLKKALAIRAGAVCIVDDCNPRWSDISDSADPTAFHAGEEVYHLLAQHHGDEGFIDAISNGNTIWHGVSAVCALPPEIDGARMCSAGELQRCASSVLLLTCTAYDGEGFVAWRKTSV
jgi:hypothetical protein